MQNRNFLDYFIVTLKGMAMGAADVVPGVLEVQLLLFQEFMKNF